MVDSESKKLSITRGAYLEFLPNIRRDAEFGNLPEWESRCVVLGVFFARIVAVPLDKCQPSTQVEGFLAVDRILFCFYLELMLFVILCGFILGVIIKLIGIHGK